MIIALLQLPICDIEKLHTNIFRKEIKQQENNLRKLAVNVLYIKCNELFTIVVK